MVDSVKVSCPKAGAACPPNDAAPASGDVFLGVRQNPPTKDDLKTAAEKGRFVSGDECQRCGLSVFKTVADLRHAQDLLPTIGKMVARATLLPEHGYLKHTPSTKSPPHHTFWTADGLTRESLFTVVEDRTRE